MELKLRFNLKMFSGIYGDYSDIVSTKNRDKIK